MTLYKNRDKLAGPSAVIGKAFAFLPANAWTMLALLLTFVTAYFLFNQQFVYAAVLFAVTAFLDAIDGAVARQRKEASTRGAYFDTVADRYMEGIIIVAMFFLPLPPLYAPFQFWLALYFFGSMMTTYVKAAAAEKLGKDARGGILERPERMILLFAGIVAAYFSAIYLVYMVALIAVLSNVTALQRIKIALKLNHQRK